MLNIGAMFSNIASMNTSEDTLDTEELSEEQLSMHAAEMCLSLDVMIGQTNLITLGSERTTDLLTYVNKYGIDRVAMEVYNRDGMLTELSDGVIPSIENYDDTYINRYTEACMEGLGETIAKIFRWCWEKVKALLKWIYDKFVKFLKFLGRMFVHPVSEFKAIIRSLIASTRVGMADISSEYRIGMEDTNGSSGEATPDNVNRFIETVNKCVEGYQKELDEIKNNFTDAKKEYDEFHKLKSQFKEIYDRDVRNKYDYERMRGSSKYNQIDNRVEGADRALVDAAAVEKITGQKVFNELGQTKSDRGDLYAALSKRLVDSLTIIKKANIDFRDYVREANPKYDAATNSRYASDTEEHLINTMREAKRDYTHPKENWTTQFMRADFLYRNIRELEDSLYKIIDKLCAENEAELKKVEKDLKDQNDYLVRKARASNGDSNTLSRDRHFMWDYQVVLGKRILPGIISKFQENLRFLTYIMQGLAHGKQMENKSFNYYKDLRNRYCGDD